MGDAPGFWSWIWSPKQTAEAVTTEEVRSRLTPLVVQETKKRLALVAGGALLLGWWLGRKAKR